MVNFANSQGCFVVLELGKLTRSLSGRRIMLGTLAVILLLVWILGLSLHWLGSLIYIALVLAVILGIAHFLTGGRRMTT